MTGRRAAYAAPLTVGIVLVALAVATTLGFLAIMKANARVIEARNLVTLHLAAQKAVAAEAAAEAGYRRAPGPEARSRFVHGVVAPAVISAAV